MEIKKWLQEQIAEETGLKAEEISLDQEFETLNLDSLSLLSLSYELEKILDREIDPTAFAEYNTINKLEEWINSQK